MNFGNNWIWILIILFCCCGCGSNGIFGGCGNGCGDNSLIILLFFVLICCCGNGIGNLGICEAK